MVSILIVVLVRRVGLPPSGWVFVLGFVVLICASGICFNYDAFHAQNLGIWLGLQQEDEEMLVPHTDLAKNNHQPMEGPGAVNFIIDHGELDFVFVQDRKVIHVEKGHELDLLLVYGPVRSHLGFPAWRLRYTEIM
ncbi:hypothetical protein HKD37_10G028470 [Glycine soja]